MKNDVSDDVCNGFADARNGEQTGKPLAVKNHRHRLFQRFKNVGGMGVSLDPEVIRPLIGEEAGDFSEASCDLLVFGHDVTEGRYARAQGMEPKRRADQAHY